MEKDKKQNDERSNANTGQEHDTNREQETNENTQNQHLTKQELPDSTNESRGNMGSGQRQNSN